MIYFPRKRKPLKKTMLSYDQIESLLDHIDHTLDPLIDFYDDRGEQKVRPLCNKIASTYTELTLNQAREFLHNGYISITENPSWILWCIQDPGLALIAEEQGQNMRESNEYYDLICTRYGNFIHWNYTIAESLLGKYQYPMARMLNLALDLFEKLCSTGICISRSGYNEIKHIGDKAILGIGYKAKNDKFYSMFVTPEGIKPRYDNDFVLSVGSAAEMALEAFHEDLSKDKLLKEKYLQEMLGWKPGLIKVPEGLIK